MLLGLKNWLSDKNNKEKWFGVIVINLFFFVVATATKYARVFILGRFFLVSLIIATPTRTPLSAAKYIPRCKGGLHPVKF